MSSRWTSPLLLIGAACVVAWLAVGAPLLVYSITLAVFGLPHVLVELRYVDERFRDRLSRPLLLGIGGLLTGIVLLRVTAFAGWTRQSLVPLELGLVVALVAAAGFAVGRRALGTRMLAGLAALVLAAGALWAPLTMLVLLAVLHNLTPVGFLAEALRGSARRRALLLCAATFGALPLVILSGLPELALEALGGRALDVSVLRLGTLRDHLGAFVPAPWQGDSLGVRVFSLAAYLQCLHYAVVLYVLPRLGRVEAAPPSPRRSQGWLSRHAFGLSVTTVSSVFLLWFALSFVEARTVYGFFAAVHAWVELPILLIALGGIGAVRPRAMAR